MRKIQISDGVGSFDRMQFYSLNFQPVQFGPTAISTRYNFNTLKISTISLMFWKTLSFIYGKACQVLFYLQKVINRIFKPGHNQLFGMKDKLNSVSSATCVIMIECNREC